MVLMLMTVTMLVGLPLAAVVALLGAVGRIERARETRIARQVAVTDAIHRELGAVVAPVVRRRFGGRFRVEIAVPFQSPATVGRVASIAHAALRGDAVDVVLTAQEPRELRIGAREREVRAWTSTNMSRAS